MQRSKTLISEYNNINFQISRKIATKLHKKPKISLIICTHNRDSILETSLNKNIELLNNENIELVVVLNACTDRSKQIALELQKRFLSFSIVEEERIGLSHARNSGAHHAKTDWLFYIDDDAYLDPSSLTSLLEVIQTPELWAFSGRILYWKANSPQWIRDEFIESPVYAETRTAIALPAYIHGCALGINKDKLLTLGGFNHKLGMHGKNIAYTEEIDLQQRIEKKNGLILFDPLIQVYHQSHFRTVIGFLNSSFKKGQYAQKINAHVKWKHLVKGVIYSLLALASVIVNTFRFGYKAAVVKSFSQAAYEFGRVF